MMREKLHKSSANTLKQFDRQLSADLAAKSVQFRKELPEKQGFQKDRPQQRRGEYKSSATNTCDHFINQSSAMISQCFILKMISMSVEVQMLLSPGTSQLIAIRQMPTRSSVLNAEISPAGWRKIVTLERKVDISLVEYQWLQENKLIWRTHQNRL